MAGKRINMFSYGSGAAASMFRWHAEGTPAIDRTVPARLAERRRHAPATFVELAKNYSSAYGGFDFSPPERDDEMPGVSTSIASTSGAGGSTSSGRDRTARARSGLWRASRAVEQRSRASTWVDVGIVVDDAPHPPRCAAPRRGADRVETKTCTDGVHGRTQSFVPGEQRQLTVAQPEVG